MKICCIANNGRNLPEIYISPERGYHRDREFSVTIGNEYIVYALYQLQEKIILLFLFEDHDRALILRSS